MYYKTSLMCLKSSLWVILQKANKIEEKIKFEILQEYLLNDFPKNSNLFYFILKGFLA